MAFNLQLKNKPVVDPATYSPKFLLHSHLVREDKARPYTRVHASDLMAKEDFCPREYALGMKYNNPRRDTRLSCAESVTYSYGYAVEDLVRGWYSQMDRAWGHWECLACEKLHMPLQRRPAKCSCGSKGFKYREITFKCQQTGVTCRPDLFLDFGKPRLTVLEIKSIDKEEIKKLVAPLAEHRWRTNAYMRIIENSASEAKERIDCQDAFVMYVTKGGYGFKDEQVRRWKLLDGDFSPFKEFPITRDDSATDHLFSLAGMVDDYRRTGKVPLGICPTALCHRAKFCRQASRCFSGDD